MEFIFAGTGTSQGVPVIGCECEVCQSKDPYDKRLRTAGVLRSEKTTICFDAGPDFRQQMLREEIKVLDAVVFTHQHKDHTAGLDDVRAYNFRLKRDMPVYGTTAVLEHLKREYYYIFEQSDYPGVPKLDLREIDSASFRIGDLELLPIPLMHGPMPVFGYRIGDFAYITDANYISDASRERLDGVRYLTLNALRKAKHHSHFNLEEAIQLAQEIGAEQTYFLHISHLMGKHADVSKELPSGIQFAYDGLRISW
ncbi:MAG: MBL fold metallo-hydrolase [Bacteroidota bacterium]